VTTYSDAVSFLESFIDYERHRGRMKYNTRTLHLRRFERFLHAIGSPHRALPYIHLAGSKGKGSTAAILHSILVAAGLRSGLFTSPHLTSYCERIQINRRPVTKRRFARAIDKLRREISAGDAQLEPGYRTTFELLTALALEVFRDDGAEIGVLETGLGGRLDATNVVPARLAIITAIGLDHTHLLGRTHGAIAREKAGIIKPGRPVVVSRQARGRKTEVLDVVAEICASRGSPRHYAPSLVRILGRRESPGGQTVRVRLHRSGAELDCPLPLMGEHQAANLQMALAAVELLRDDGWEITDDAIVTGAAQVRWPGRMEYLPGPPPLVLDGAHCPLSVAALVKTLAERFAALEPVFLFSMLDDKDVEPMIRPLARRFAGARVIVFRAPSVRGRSPGSLVGPLRQQRLEAQSVERPVDAVRQALALVEEGNLLVAFGTLYSIEPVRRAFRRLTGNRP
jgi:dihydrofolate synthase/folylpolyglutamate synthase